MACIFCPYIVRTVFSKLKSFKGNRSLQWENRITRKSEDCKHWCSWNVITSTVVITQKMCKVHLLILFSKICTSFRTPFRSQICRNIPSGICVISIRYHTFAGHMLSQKLAKKDSIIVVHKDLDIFFKVQYRSYKSGFGVR